MEALILAFVGKLLVFILVVAALAMIGLVTLVKKAL
jgi:hypothetical protein